MRRNGIRGRDDAMVVGTAMLPDVFVGFAKHAVDVGRDSGELGDDAATVSPASKDDQSYLRVHAGPVLELNIPALHTPPAIPSRKSLAAP